MMSSFLVVTKIVLAQENSEYVKLFSSIERFLIETRKEYYNIDSFKFVIEDNEFYKDMQDIIVTCNITLKKKPEETPYVKAIIDTKDRLSINNPILDSYHSSLIAEIGEYYLKPRKANFIFAINKKDKLTMENLKALCYKEILPLQSLLINNEKLYMSGVETVKNFNKLEIEQKPILDRAYNRIAARDYALSHWNDTPEYPSPTIPDGTDCANFVSKCINSGGVVPYMLNKGYFYHQPVREYVNAGSIVSWNDYSHVGLITYGDTIEQRYTAHSRAVYDKILPANANVSFYMPN